MVKLEKVNCVNTKFSDDGSKLMVMKSNSVISVYDCKSTKEIRSFEVSNVVAAILSPRGTYLQTFKKPAPQEKNVTLWKTETGDSVYQHSQKNMTKTNWPAIQFSSDEATACRMATNEVVQSDVDKTNQSYYGESKLCYLTTDGGMGKGGEKRELGVCGG
ncbi:WD40/YVTN repeat-like-containing domain superfamily [Sesbania bispinosa]|nr:WD40/YVTN repeat-like-containing domain superfamily [Sesbania bispinosa]